MTIIMTVYYSVFSVGVSQVVRIGCEGVQPPPPPSSCLEL